MNSQSNNLSLIEVIEQINLPAPPPSEEPIVFPMQFAVVSTWLREGDETSGIFRARILSPEGEALPMPLSEFRVEFEDDRPRSRTVLAANGFPVHGDGTYRVEVLRERDNGDWTPEASIPVVVVFELSHGAEELYSPLKGV
ncbi:MAG TPA: hypothetical protein VMG98_02395 [Verrucomicrobiae bacterium]|nr:hypothetical protein [Verrucomicrobiae bacterium]